MSHARTLMLTLLALLAFAGNSLLCRVALTRSAIDPASFTTLRLLSGALLLWLLLRWRGDAVRIDGSWVSASALFVYAAGFSFAYLTLPAATGALLLFGAVQATMFGVGLLRGERLRASQQWGLVVALAGLLGLLMPGLGTPSLSGSMLMLAAGTAWGIYSLRGSGSADPLRVTAGNFIRTVPFALLLSLAWLDHSALDRLGLACAVASGALTSALGYVIWYRALPALRATTAATVQLSVPLITAMGGVVLLGEALSAQLVLAAIAILGGIALVIRQGSRASDAARR